MDSWEIATWSNAWYRFLLAALFHKLTQALEVLVDQQARAAYDKLMKAKMERLKKQREMDSKRRAAQSELEERENRAKKAKMEQDQAEAQYYAELARLRAEGAKRREEWREEQPQEGKSVHCSVWHDIVTHSCKSSRKNTWTHRARLYPQSQMEAEETYLHRVGSRGYLVTHWEGGFNCSFRKEKR